MPIIWVNSNNGGTVDGSNYNTGYPLLQTALDNSSNGDEIRVNDGFHILTTNYSVGHDITLSGGWIDENDNNSITTLDGDRGDYTLKCGGDLIIEKFAFSNGSRAIECVGSITMNECIIENNTSSLPFTIYSVGDFVATNSNIIGNSVRGDISSIIWAEGESKLTECLIDNNNCTTNEEPSCGEANPVSDFSWNGDDTIIGYNGDSLDVIIPTINNGVAVTSIGASAFNGGQIQSICGESIINIEDRAFHTCSFLVSASFPSATNTGDSVFENCSSLNSVSLLSLEIIGESVFQGCASLDSISLPELIDAGNNTFFNCTGMISASLPLLANLGDFTFYGCSSLTSTFLPSVVSIGEYAFDYCASLTSISFPNVAIIENNTFENCTGLDSISLPKVTSIGSNALRNCISLTSVSLPEAITIGGFAFYECTDLVSISLPNIISISSNAFRGSTSLTTAYFPSDAPTITGTSFADTSLTTVYIPCNSIPTGYGEVGWPDDLSILNGILVIFDMNGVGERVPDQFLECANLGAVEPSSPISSNFIFIDWYTDNTLTTPFLFNVSLFSDTPIVIYAGWRETVYWTLNSPNTYIAPGVVQSIDNAPPYMSFSGNLITGTPTALSDSNTKVITTNVSRFVGFNVISATENTYILRSDGDSSLINCIVSDNESTSGGNSYIIASSDATLVNCLLVENTSNTVLSTIDSKFANVTIVDNVNQLIARSRELVIYNSIVYNNTNNGFSFTSSIIEYSLVQGLFPLDNGNLDEDPKLDSSYKLETDSPCIDSGNNSLYSLSYPRTDLAGDPRFVDSTGDREGCPIDMGAYEYQCDGCETCGDPHIKPLIGKIYDLPDDDGIYNLFDNNSSPRVVINTKLWSLPKRQIARYREIYKGRNIYWMIHKSYHKYISIRVDEELLVIDLENLSPVRCVDRLVSINSLPRDVPRLAKIDMGAMKTTLGVKDVRSGKRGSRAAKTRVIKVPGLVITLSYNLSDLNRNSVAIRGQNLSSCSGALIRRDIKKLKSLKDTT